jgi:hypothetical protein
MIRKWWIVLFLMIGCGFLGVLITHLQKPIFESQSSITTSIDFAYAGRMTEDDEDYLMETIGDVIESDEVFERLQDNAALENITVDDKTLQSKFTKARQGYRWELTVRDTNPVMAQKLTQLWTDSADLELKALREFSIDALRYQTSQMALENCFSQLVVLAPVSGNCSTEEIADIRDVFNQNTVDENVPSLTEAVLLSKISTEVTDNAYLPSNPVIFKQNINALVGSVAGLLIGLAGFILWKPK